MLLLTWFVKELTFLIWWPTELKLGLELIFGRVFYSTRNFGTTLSGAQINDFPAASTASMQYAPKLI